MKTFRFFATLLVITLCAGFTSCGNDDDNDGGNIISKGAPVVSIVEQVMSQKKWIGILFTLMEN